MKKLVLTVFACLSLMATQAQDHSQEVFNNNITPYHDALESMSGVSKSYLLQQKPWKDFQTKYPDWGASFNSYTQLPHRAFGTPISFTPGGNNPVTKALMFIQQELGGFSIPLNELVLTRNFNDGKYIHVDFKQVHNNMDVLWSRVSVRFTQDLRIMLFGMDAHRQIPALNVALSPANATSVAEQALTTAILNSEVASNVFLFPYPIEGQYKYRPAYQVTVNTQDDKETPGRYVTYVDAIDGKILYRQNKVVHVGFNVKADLYPTNLFSPLANLPLKNLLVNYNATNYYTDANGDVSLPASATYNGTLTLTGKFIKIVTGQSGTTSPTYAYSNVASGSVLTFPQSSPNATERHMTCYFHANEIHDFMKSKFPTFTAMDNPLTARVDRTDGNCNAFYDGSSINFYTTSNGCNALSLISDVMYHEYGHGITNVFWNDQGSSFDNGAMGEGYSDIWAASITKSPIIGPGFNIGQASSYIRRYDINPKVYPQNIVGEVHADGEIIAGAWWDYAINLGGNLSTAIDTMADLFAASHYGLATGPDGAEGQVYHDILIDALTYDDNDNNINNGTPHFMPIVQAFAKHGIYLLSNTELQHTAPEFTSAGNAVTMNALAIPDYPAFLGDVKMFYRLRGTTSTDSLLMSKSGTNYTGNFPSSTNAGEIYEYYFTVYDNANIPSAQAPISSKFNLGSTQRNLPYFLMVGYYSAYLQNFDSITTSTPNWTIGSYASDNATGGKWIVATPVPSLTGTGGDTIQTGHDHTTGTGLCAVTGNAASPTTVAGNADVDGGRTSLLTGEFDLSNYTKPVLSYWRWYSNSQGNNPRKDVWKVYASYTNGSTWLQVEKNFQPDVSWRRNLFVPDLSKGTKVRFLFIATDSVITGTGGSWIEAAVDDIEILDLGAPSSINSVNALQAMIYPNPAHQSIQIVTSEKGLLTYSLMNTVGEVVLSKQTWTDGNLPLSVSNLPSGIYFVRLKLNEQQSVMKVRVQH